ncbi:unnamed protein product [Lampetra planeri]
MSARQLTPPTSRRGAGEGTERAIVPFRGTHWPAAAVRSPGPVSSGVRMTRDDVTAPHGGDKMAANRCPLAAVPKDEDGPAPAMTSCTPAESPVAVPSVPSVPGTATS